MKIYVCYPSYWENEHTGEELLIVGQPRAAFSRVEDALAYCLSDPHMVFDTLEVLDEWQSI